MITISNIKIHIDETKSVREIVCDYLKINNNDIKTFAIIKESIDARKRDDIYFIYSIKMETEDEDKILQRFENKKVKFTITKVEDKKYQSYKVENLNTQERPIIVGSGPCGLFCGLILAEAGLKPIIVERGKSVEERMKDVKNFWKDRKFNSESNVQFGEGGAGTFSDGKLTTLVKDAELRMQKVLEEFVEAGANEDILYKHKPHIGTDMLVTIVQNIRKKIVKLGGKVLFESKLTNIEVENGKVRRVEINGHENIDASIVVLAIGHSARDTFKMLYENEIKMEQKPFSIGVRIEHKQDLIDQSQYGKYAKHKKLGAADYKLSYHSKNGRSAYTFCMCPGGEVVAAASEEGMVVTNGMSENARMQENANSALLVNVTPEDYETDHPLAGVEYQRKWERLAYELGGSNYNAPAQLVGDFLRKQKSENLGDIQNSYTPGVTMTDLRQCLPEYVTDTMYEALMDFDKKIKGFARNDALLTGVETRSSSPVRITRDMQCESVNVGGLYPAGEGAGYAGGIMSAAIDGIKVAEVIIKKAMKI